MKNFLILFFFLVISDTLYAQQWSRFGGNTITSSEYLGGDGSSTVPLRFKTILNYSIDFYTTDILRLSILGNTNPGFVGVGSFTPNFKFDVDSGDINLNTFTNGYRIGGSSTSISEYVVWHNGNRTNIFIGTGAGNVNSTNWNTLIGSDCGNSIITNGNGNTMTGHVTGFSTTEGEFNSFYGDSAAYFNTTGSQNTFIGAAAGKKTTTGEKNTYIGARAGFENPTGTYNVFTGRNAGYYGTGSANCFYGKDVGFYNYGNQNSFYGHHAGYNQSNNVFANPLTPPDANSFYGWASGLVFYDGRLNSFYGAQSGAYLEKGDSNVFIGALSGTDANLTDMSNSIALGYHSIVKNDNMCIIGNNIQNVGIGLSDDNIHAGPRSKLEINADPASTNVTLIGGSGLRFRQLTSGTPATTADAWTTPWGGVLTVDNDGIVKLTNSTFGYGLCGQGIVTLPEDIGMFFDDFNIYHEGDGYNSTDLDMNNAIGIGYQCYAVLPGKLSVDQSNDDPSTDNVQASTVAGYFHNGDYSFCPSQNVDKRAVYGICDGLSLIDEECRYGLMNAGGDFIARGSAQNNFGVRGRVFDNQNLGEFNIGGFFEGDNSPNFNVGVWGSTSGVSGATSYGVYGYAPNVTCTNGGFATCPQAAGFFNGDCFAMSGYFQGSDINLKSNIQPLINNISIIKQLQPKSFTYKINQFPNHSLPDGIHDGLIAQDVLNVLPHLVKALKVPPTIDSLGNMDTTATSNTFLSVNYIGLIPYLIGAFKEQQDGIDSLTSLLSQMQSQIDNCCNASGHLRKSTDVELSDETSIILDKNSPNPFSEETYITYTIPERVSKAMIIIYNQTGVVLKKVVIEERGEGSLHVYAEKLSSGVYTYSLVADGITIDSKQMVCQK